VTSLADELSPAGWPRPWYLWTPPSHRAGPELLPRFLPVPWINGSHPYRGDWVSFDKTRSEQAHRRRLCGVCGQPLEQVALLGRRSDRITSGPGCHPRCMELTLATCPHFTDPPAPLDADAVVAWRVDGPRPGYLTAGDQQKPYEGVQHVDDELPGLAAHDVQVLAGVDPWGTGRPDTTDTEDTVADE
jgi:hypothetical protein